MKKYKTRTDTSVDVSWYLSKASLIDRVKLILTNGKFGRSHYVCLETITTEIIFKYVYEENVETRGVVTIVRTTDRDESKHVIKTNRYKVLKEMK